MSVDITGKSTNNIIGFDKSIEGKVAIINSAYKTYWDNGGDDAGQGSLGYNVDTFFGKYRFDDEPEGFIEDGFSWSSEGVSIVTFPLQTNAIRNSNNQSSMRESAYFLDNSWIIGTIMGVATGNISDNNRIEIKLFNPLFNNRGGFVYLITAPLKYLNLVSSDSNITGKVFKPHQLRGNGINSTDYFYEDGSWAFYPDSNVEPIPINYTLHPPKASLGKYIDPNYVNLHPELIQYENKYGNEPYNYASISKLALVNTPFKNLQITNLGSKGFYWNCEFNWGNTPHHWYDIGAMKRKGLCYSIHTNPTVNDSVSERNFGKSSFENMRQPKIVTGLTANTTYYLKPFQERELLAGGTEIIYGDEIEIKTSIAPIKPIFGMGSPYAITNNSINVNLWIDNIGESNWVECGFVYSSTNSSPSILDNKFNCPITGTIQYMGTRAIITGLQSNTKYYIRAFIKTEYHGVIYFNFEGHSYGVIEDKDVKNTEFNSITNVWSFITKQSTGLASPQITEIENIVNTGAVATSYYFGDGGIPINECGICISTNTKPTILDKKIVSTEISVSEGLFITELTGLISDTSYFIRSYILNDNGISYGWERSFKTTRDVLFKDLKSLNITTSEASIFAVVDDLKPSSIIKRGFVISNTNNTNNTLIVNNSNEVYYSDTTGNGVMEIKCTSLTNGLKYFYRAFITYNNSDYYYSDIYEVVTNTTSTPPIVALKDVEVDTVNKKVKFKINVISTGGSSTTYYSAISTLNLTSDKPYLSKQIATDSEAINSLIQCELDLSGYNVGIYYLRVYAENIAGKSVSSEFTINYKPLSQTIPSIGVSTSTIEYQGIFYSAVILNSGNSTIIDKVLSVEKLNTVSNEYEIEKTLSLSASTDNISIFKYSNENSLDKLTVSSKYKLKLKVKTEYTEFIDNGDKLNYGVDIIDGYAVSEFLFETPDTWINPNISDVIFIDFEQIKYTNEKSNKPKFKVSKYIGELKSSGKIRINGRFSSDTSEIGKAVATPDSTKKNGDVGIEFEVGTDNSFEYTFELTKPGIWGFKAYYIENADTISERIIENPAVRYINVSSSDIYASNNSDVNLDEENMYSLIFPTVGNYDGREWFTARKRFVFNVRTNAWERDFTYKYNSVVANNYINSYSGSTPSTLNSTENEIIEKAIKQMPKNKLNVKPNLYDVVDGFTCIGVVEKDHSDIDLFDTTKHYASVWVKLDAIENDNYARAKEVAQAYNCDLFNTNKIPQLAVLLQPFYNIKLNIGGDNIWTFNDEEGETANIICFDTDTWVVSSEYIPVEYNSWIIPTRILIDDKYESTNYNWNNSSTIQHDDLTHRYSSSVANLKVCLVDKSDSSIINSIDIPLNNEGTIKLKGLVITDGGGVEAVEFVVKYEYINSLIDEKNGYEYWIDEVNTHGMTISPADYELLIFTK